MPQPGPLQIPSRTESPIFRLLHDLQTENARLRAELLKAAGVMKLYATELEGFAKATHLGRLPRDSRPPP